MSYITFGLGERTLALPMRAVEAVERPGRFTAVPFAAPWLRGVTSVRGAVISVVDLGRLMGGVPAGLTPSARLLVTKTGAARTALLVDRVGAIATAPDAEILDPDRLLSSDAFADYQLPEERGAN